MAKNITCLFSSIFLNIDCKAIFCWPLLFLFLSILLFVTDVFGLSVGTSVLFRDSSRSSRDFSNDPWGFKIPPFFSEPKSKFMNNQNCQFLKNLKVPFFFVASWLSTMLKDFISSSKSWVGSGWIDPGSKVTSPFASFL